MATLDTKKIGAVLKQLENAAKAGLKALNDATDGSYAGSPFEKHPLESIGGISLLLQQLYGQAQKDIIYEGLTEEQIADRKAADRAAELAALQATVQGQLVEILTPVVFAEEEPEPVDEPDANSGGTL
ncbi:hypothetical protein GO730_00575 [Spirosoma sp. HMF3257]|uniref:Uncharacterized protein n=1 Tax=Spirosoma telluris TaxID=2183553 RepID=A0A327NH79_9BACT|nr:hypothetical protein [Spirosoma telluris]RAI73294.1 hypothetical protein HMF3257_00560 [Spirosoma telluris]